MTKQKGMTFLGLVILIALGAFIAITAAKVTPAYVEFASIKKTLNNIANNPDFNSMSNKDIADAFDKAASAGYITVIQGKDLAISKTDQGNQITAEYQVTVPLVANASLLLDFNASTAK